MLLKKISWIFGALIAGKVVNEILYSFLNGGIGARNLQDASLLRAAIPALGASLIVALGFYFAFKKEDARSIEESNPKNVYESKNVLAISKQNLYLVIIGILAFSGLLALKGFGGVSIFKGNFVYKVYSCKIADMFKQDCQKEYVGTAQFFPDKDKSIVAIQFTESPSGEKGITTLSDCTIIDSKNWRCGGKSTIENGVWSTSNLYLMGDGKVDVSSGSTSILRKDGSLGTVTPPNSISYVKND